MKSHLAASVLVAVLVATIGMAPAHGQILEAISVTLDKESYANGEQIVVTGQLREDYKLGVTVVVEAPNGNRIATAQPEVQADRSFSTTFTAGGNLMKQIGTYTIKVQHGGETRSAETTFEYTGGDAPDQPAPEAPSQVVDSALEGLTFEIVGGEVISISPDVESTSLVIRINAFEDGTLTITMPRAVIDARADVTEGADELFIVVVDGDETDSPETSTTDTHRTLVIDFPAASELIEIYGTFVIPEFGVIAVMILAVAIVTVIAVSSRSRLSIVPRY